jgi:hypothetical protein
MLKGPTFRFKTGRVIEVEHLSGSVGYLIAHFHRPRYGSFFTLVTRAFESPLPDDRIHTVRFLPKTTVWLNTYQLLTSKGDFTFRHRCDLPDYSGPEPSFWTGMVEYSITIQHPDGSEEHRKTSLSEADWEVEMERKGIIHKVLWLPKDIGMFLFDGVPLRWTAHKKY